MVLVLSEQSRKIPGLLFVKRRAARNTWLHQMFIFYTKLIPLDTNLCLTKGLQWQCKWMLNRSVCKDWESGIFSNSSVKSKGPLLSCCTLWVSCYCWWQGISPGKAHLQGLILSSRSCPFHQTLHTCYHKHKWTN